MITAGNFKMNKLPSEIPDYLEILERECSSLKTSHSPIILCLPFTHIPAAVAVNNPRFNIYAQNFFYEEKGAYTGEISLDMLKNLGVTGVIIGHSERRQYFGETDDIINKKVIAAKRKNMSTILCVGEELSQRELGADKARVELQLRNDLKDIKDLSNIMIAYEPIWAIGTGKSASAKDAEEMCQFIQDVLESIEPGSSDDIAVLYGGSVKSSNAAELFAQPHIDGALVGGACLDPYEFGNIIKSANM